MSSEVSMEIKYKAFLALIKLGGRATEKVLTDEYIKMYPDYTKGHKKTKKTSEEKIRGTINSILSRNESHKNIKVDKNIYPAQYYIVPDNHIVIQPIGTRSSIEEFMKQNSTRWAEKRIYEDKWLQSYNGTVLFTKKGKIFAKGFITNIEDSKEEKYPLDFYYNLTIVDNIDYKKVLEIANPNLTCFRKYTLLDLEKSAEVFKYINSEQIVYLNDNEANLILQDTLTDIKPVNKNEAPQPVKEAKIQNGIKVFPRNLAYSKQALENANYTCEFDNTHKTFISNSTNKQFMEAHHLIPLKVQDVFNYSLDVPGNIVSLCPSCHRKIHLGILKDKKEMIQFLLNKREETLLKYAIEVNEDKLKTIYRYYKEE